jgi:hypothetical protein
MLVILSILAFTFTSAFKSPRVIKVNLISVDFQREKGVTFKFWMDGDLRKSDLKGNVLVKGNSLRLYCNYSGDATPTVVVCTSAKGTAARYAGRLAVVSVAGHSFYFTVPSRP